VAKKDRLAKAALRESLKAPDRFLYRNSVVGFALFSFFVIIAFWRTYFSRLSNQPEFRFHTHGLALSLWCALLIAQAHLIRTGRKALHRAIGKTSYAAALLVVITTINLLHFRLRGQRLTPSTLYFSTLVLNALLVFIAFFGLAMYYRRTPALHARFMLCTVFPLFTPVTDRLIAFDFPSLIDAVPIIAGNPAVQVAGFILADALLAALTLWDWRANKRADAFPVALAMLVVYHASVLTFFRLPLYHAFADWFMRLPLS
jgi:hypothetical protein